MPKAKKNPPLVVFGNPPKAEWISADVKAIIYVHAETGELMVHGFGHGGDAFSEKLIDVLHRHHIRPPQGGSNVAALARKDGTIVLKHERNDPLWGKF